MESIGSIIKNDLIRFVTGLILLGACVSCGPGTSDEPPVPSTLQGYLQAQAANNKLSGTVFIAKGDTVLFEQSYGLANQEFSLPNQSTTKFLIGSITKPFTAYAILLLEQQGKLSLDDRLSSYFPDFPKADQVTIKHLLNHTSGITDYHAFPQWVEDSKCDLPPDHSLSTLLERPYQFEPGERFSYSNSGYILLGLIIEKVSGETFQGFIQKEILTPLGLTETGIASNTTVIPRLASGYFTTPRQTYKASYINYNQPFASGNMYSTPRDLWKFTQAVVNHRMLPSDKTAAIFNSTHGYGYGWGIRNYQETLAYGHLGAMNGFVGAITYLPESKHFICFLTNNDNTPKYTLTEDLVALVQGKNIDLPKAIGLVPLTKNMQQAAVGSYLVKAGDTLRVYERNHSLYMQETGQLPHELFPVDSLEYAFALFEFQARFSKPRDGASDTLRFVGGSKVMAVRITEQQEVER